MKISRVTQWWALSIGEKQALFAASLLLPAFWLALRLLGLQRCRAFLLKSVPLPFENSTSFTASQSLGHLVNLAARHSIFPVTCLTRSLLLEWMLRRRRQPALLHIGVRKQAASLEAHAWVECAGVPVNDAANVASLFLPLLASLASSTHQQP